jgi:hypothetical protein
MATDHVPGLMPDEPAVARRNRVLTHTLDLLTAMTEAAGGAVWYVASSRLELVKARDVDQRAFDRTEAAMRFDQLVSSAPLVRVDHAILPVPLGVGRGAVFYLSEPRGIGQTLLEVPRLLAHVAACLTSEVQPEADGRTSAIERRRALTELVEREEWNLSKVARRLRVSRPTIYRWLDEYGLGRPGGKRRGPTRT